MCTKRQQLQMSMCLLKSPTKTLNRGNKSVSDNDLYTVYSAIFNYAHRLLTLSALLRLMLPSLNYLSLLYLEFQVICTQMFYITQSIRRV